MGNYIVLHYIVSEGFLKDHISKENRRILRELLCCSVFASFDLSWSTNQMKLHMVITYMSIFLEVLEKL